MSLLRKASVTYRDTAPGRVTSRHWVVSNYSDLVLDWAVLAGIDAAWETAARRLGIDLTTGPPAPRPVLEIRSPAWIQPKSGCVAPTRARGLALIAPGAAFRPLTAIVDDPRTSWLVEHEAGHLQAFWWQGIDPKTHPARSERAASLAEGHPISMLGAWLRGWWA